MPSGGGSSGNAGPFGGTAPASGSPSAGSPSMGSGETVISGLGSRLRDIFKGPGKKRDIHSPTGKPDLQRIQPFYIYSETIDKRLLQLADYYYREGSFEKIQFARKWMRNALIFQGYHELEWSEINVAWDVVLQDSGDYAFPNNYYRQLVYMGMKAYVKNAPIIEPIPSNDDAEAQAASKAARTALEIIKRTVHYDAKRVIEAENLYLFGNSFRFNYYSNDSRFGYAVQPVMEDHDVVMSGAGSVCAQCGNMEGMFDQCPYCGQPIAQHTPPLVQRLPFKVGSVTYPKGEVMMEVVNPMEMYVRNGVYYDPALRYAPFVCRNRVVDRLALQAAHPNMQLAPVGDEGGGEAYSTGGDLGLIYLQSLSDLPGDPTQYAAWYERAAAAAKALLIEVWLRPSAYFFDKELMKEFPDGLYIRKTGNVLLKACNDCIEDHWTHYVFTPVPGRVWGDGADDIIPQQLKLDEVDRLIQRNQGYNSVPLLAIDSQRIDKKEVLNDPSTIIEVKAAGRPVRDAFDQIKPGQLTTETWQWREAHKYDMQIHARSNVQSVGMHQPGVNTMGGQESMAAKADDSLLPNLMLWKACDEVSARQQLKLASENWLDTRVHAVYGIEGRYEFEKLRGAALDMDKFTIVSRVLPVDPTQQDAFSQAVASGALDPQDPRVKRKMMELFKLPLELDEFYKDAKVQWKEIEYMKQGIEIAPLMIRDNHAVHIDVCRTWMNSDEGMDELLKALPLGSPLYQSVDRHMEMHMISMANWAQAQGMIQSLGGMDQGQQQPGQPQQGGPRQPSEGTPQEGKQKGKKGGQVPPNAQTRQQRAHKGAEAKPHRPQPSSGNQYNRQPMS